MVCNVCGWKEFRASEYKMDSGTAPALECTHCGALNLDEETAGSEKERESVREAKAARVLATPAVETDSESKIKSRP